MTGQSAHIVSTNIGKDGKCPECRAELIVISETEERIRWKCSSCEKTWGAYKEEEVT